MRYFLVLALILFCSLPTYAVSRCKTMGKNEVLSTDDIERAGQKLAKGLKSKKAIGRFDLGAYFDMEQIEKLFKDVHPDSSGGVNLRTLTPLQKKIYTNFRETLIKIAAKAAGVTPKKMQYALQETVEYGWESGGGPNIHLDGGYLIFSVALRGPGTDTLGLAPFYSDNPEDYDKVSSLINDRDIQKYSGRRRPRRAKPGEIVVFWGMHSQSGNKPAYHRTPRRHRGRVLFLLRVLSPFDNVQSTQ